MDGMNGLGAVTSPDRSISIETFVELVERVLERSGVATHENFFEAGGSSLSALSLALEIERVCGRELPMSELCSAATIRDMHELLQIDGSAAHSPLVVLRRATGPNRIFFIHGLGGSTIELRDVALQLRTELTVYGIQATGLNGRAPLSTIEAMAGRYVDEIVSLDPYGPYFLLGYSLGGLIALEIGRYLLERGLEVRFLGLLDSYPARSTSSWDVMRDIARILRMEARRRRICLDRMRWSVMRDAGRRLGLMQKLNPAPPLYPEAVQRVREAARAAARQHRPLPYDGDVVFFEAETPLVTVARNPARVWRRLVRRLTVEVTPGDHHTMVQGECAAALAAVIDRHLQTAEAA